MSAYIDPKKLPDVSREEWEKFKELLKEARPRIIDWSTGSNRDLLKRIDSALAADK